MKEKMKNIGKLMLITIITSLIFYSNESQTIDKSHIVRAKEAMELKENNYETINPYAIKAKEIINKEKNTIGLKNVKVLNDNNEVINNFKNKEVLDLFAYMIKSDKKIKNELDNIKLENKFLINKNDNKESYIYFWIDKKEEKINIMYEKNRFNIYKINKEISKKIIEKLENK